MPVIKLLSSDFNGTLVYPHTMQETVRYAFPDEPDRYEEIKTVFKAQTEGKLPMAEAFRSAGRLSKGIALGSAIEYTIREMEPVQGFDRFTDRLQREGIRLLINTTGYSVTLCAFRHHYRLQEIDCRCNRLLFAGVDGRILDEDELDSLVESYVRETPPPEPNLYTKIKASGQVALGIEDERHKARNALEYARSMGILPSETAHMGDTMGDSGGIMGVAEAGGLGIAFNYNSALEAFLHDRGADFISAGRIVFVDEKGPGANLEHVLPYLTGLSR